MKKIIFIAVILTQAVVASELRWPLTSKFSERLQSAPNLNTGLNSLLYHAYSKQQMKSLNLLEAILSLPKNNDFTAKLLAIVKCLEPDESKAAKLLNATKKLAINLKLPEDAIKNCSLPTNFSCIEKNSQYLKNFREELQGSEINSTTIELVSLLTPQHSSFYRAYLLTQIEHLLSLNTQTSSELFFEKLQNIKQENMGNKKKIFQDLLRLAKILLLPENFIWILATHKVVTWISQQPLTAFYDPRLRQKITEAKKRLYFDEKTYVMNLSENIALSPEEKIVYEAYAKSNLTYIPARREDSITRLFNLITYLITGNQKNYGISLIKKLNQKTSSGIIIPLEEDHE